MTVTSAGGRRIVRLALGLEVVDAVRGDPADVEVAWENVPRPLVLALPHGPGSGAAASLYDPGIGLPRLRRGSRPGRFRMVFTPEQTPIPPARLRIVDDRRRYVPRRLEVPFAALAAVLAEEGLPDRPAPRGRTVGILPGAAFPAEGGSTGVRGRVVDQAGAPVRWVRADARHITRGSLLGVAHGDDRGEFLLLMGNPPSILDAPAGLSFDARITVHAAPLGAQPPPALTGDPMADPLGDLVPEVLPDLGDPDVVSAGDNFPAEFTRMTSTTVTCTVGRLVSPPVPIVLP